MFPHSSLQVTAVIVEGAIEQAKEDKDVAKAYRKQRLEQVLPKVREMFLQMDIDGDGQITSPKLYVSVLFFEVFQGRHLVHGTCTVYWNSRGLCPKLAQLEHALVNTSWFLQYVFVFENLLQMVTEYFAQFGNSPPGYGKHVFHSG